MRSFLGLTEYYRRFIYKKLCPITSPMTDLLKKDGFKWSEENNKSFENLKLAIVSSLVLVFPNFEKTFILETNACNSEVEVVLIQEE